MQMNVECVHTFQDYLNILFSFLDFSSLSYQKQLTSSSGHLNQKLQPVINHLEILQ